ncbi:MAG: Maf family protein [Firmicutes bacterium]|jgi:septum formation protein|nr:Maf family protein [Bacillota bacterium]
MKIVLASGSPRRMDLLNMLNVEFVKDPSGIPEDIDLNDSPESIVMSLAFQKAMDVSTRYEDGELVIGADTIVYNDQVYGKPLDRDDAYNMLKTLSGKEHSVYTGIAVVKAGSNEKVVDYVRTKVVFKDLSDETIYSYIDTQEAYGKAGAYAIQGFGSILVEEIQGDYFNIVGLPISRLSDILKNYFGFRIL